jgi:Uri superfamily endonuclease
LEKPAPQTYQLLIAIAEPLRICIGHLGCFDFPAGHYVYTGSARQNFEARISRHLSHNKKMHWHIDYLLAAPGVAIREVLRYSEAECDTNQQVTGEILVRGFGSSDCRNKCGSHLKRLLSQELTAKNQS